MMRLGFNSAGTELVFEQVLREAVKEQLEYFDEAFETPTHETFNYLEVGVAEGTTLASVAKILIGLTGARWNAYGVDLLSGPFFNPIKWMRENGMIPSEVSYRPMLMPVVDLSKSYGIAHVRLTHIGMADVKFLNTEFHFCLIDGCHGQPCVERDFLAVEPLIAPGGIVAFHDALPEDQDQDFQEHCQMPISVRKALTNLKLTTGQRPGWEFVTQVAGDKKASPPGNGFMFFRRI